MHWLERWTILIRSIHLMDFNLEEGSCAIHSFIPFLKFPFLKASLPLTSTIICRNATLCSLFVLILSAHASNYTSSKSSVMLQDNLPSMPCHAMPFNFS